MRTTITRLTTMVMAGVLTATGIAWFATPTLDNASQSAPTSSVPMTLGEYLTVQENGAEEDSDAWDCRINGNAQCADVQYDLYCWTAHATYDTMCQLDGVKVR